MQTSHLSVSLVEQNQAQKEVTVNEALIVIDALLNTGVIDKDLSTPPASPSNGDVYIVGSSAQTDWTAHENDIAYYQDVWLFITPNEGLTLWVNDEDQTYSWNGSAWVNSGGSTLSQLDGVGINTSPDNTNKLAVRSDAVLLTTDTGTIQTVINKDSSSDTASYLFQTGFSGRAEFGLVGNDDFSFKVSSNGSTFNTAFTIDNITAELHISTAFSLADGITEPSTESGKAKIYVDTADGDLKIKFGDGTIRTIVTD